MNKKHRLKSQTLQRIRSLRHSQTPAETTLWNALRNHNITYKFRRQYPIGHYIVDFYCPEVKLCIEVDGGTHYEAEQENYDNARTVFLQKTGCTVIRFTNDDIRYHLDDVIREIIKTIEALISNTSDQGSE